MTKFNKHKVTSLKLWLLPSYKSHFLRNPAFCICEKKVQISFATNLQADQRLKFVVSCLDFMTKDEISIRNQYKIWRIGLNNDVEMKIFHVY